MTNELHTNERDHTSTSFGARLQSAREARGLGHKDVAIQLRLNEKIIAQIESNNYPSDLPPTFIRGYLRAYGRLLQLPENEISEAIEPIRYKTTLPILAPLENQFTPVTSNHYFMRILNYLIILTLFGLMAVWWIKHSVQSSATTSATALSLSNNQLPASSQPLVESTPEAVNAPAPGTAIVESKVVTEVPAQNTNTLQPSGIETAASQPAAPVVNEPQKTISTPEPTMSQQSLPSKDPYNME